MRLYYFTTAEHGLAAIRDQRIKLAEINKLNDPFECLALDLTNPEIKYKSEKWKEKIFTEKHLILCLSKNWKHPLMWSHYAECHRGICLGLDISDELVAKIKYISKRINHTIEETQNFIQTENPVFTEYITLYKSKFWQYEKEYRDMFEKTNRYPVNLLYFTKFDESLKLKKILIGAKSDITIERVRSITNSLKNKVDVIETKLSESKFLITKLNR